MAALRAGNLLSGVSASNQGIAGWTCGARGAFPRHRIVPIGAPNTHFRAEPLRDYFAVYWPRATRLIPLVLPRAIVTMVRKCLEVVR